MLVYTGRAVADALIGWSVRSHFRAVYARVVAPPQPDRSVVVFANHHYWWDGYLCYALGRTWGYPMSLWMEEWRRFPPFWALGALPYPPGDTMTRAKTVRRTLRLLQQPPRVLFLFPEGVIHPGHQLLPFGRSLHWLAQHAPDAQLLPMAIVISHTLHQYPRAFLHVDAPFESAEVSPERWLEQAQQKILALVSTLREEAECCDNTEKALQAGFHLLVEGKLSVNERWWARMMP
ncbi:MAG: hypothetical protein RMM08_13250 [Armatimonadota bacterium]|nr:hypothetical protein [Armatimonadota bacterium]